VYNIYCVEHTQQREVCLRALVHIHFIRGTTTTPKLGLRELELQQKDWRIRSGGCTLSEESVSYTGQTPENMNDGDTSDHGYESHMGDHDGDDVQMFKFTQQNIFDQEDSTQFVKSVPHGRL